MSDAATPFVAPAGADAFTVADALADRLDAEDTGSAAPDTDADPVDRQPTSEAQPEDPDAGEDQSEDADPEPQPEEPPRYRVKVRGQDVEVPLSELLNGYSRTEDYKAKTAEVAEQRRALEAKQAEITARAQAMDALLASAPLDPVLAEGQKTDWLKLAQEDPAGYVQRRAAFDERLAYWNAVSAERQRTMQEAQAEAMRQSSERLAEALPEWRDETKRKEVVGKLRTTLNSYGFSEAELAGVTDHRVLLVAMDAAKWREAQAARQSAETKRAAPPPPKVIRPGTANEGANQQSKHARDLATKAKRTGRLDDQVNAVLAALE
jgi:hypothetical protein